MAEYKNFTDNIITFVKGDSSKYTAGIAQGKYVNDIFFCTDQRTIFAQGMAYGLTKAEYELLETLGTTIVSVSYDEQTHTLIFTDNLNTVTNIQLSLASDTINGLMSSGHYSKLEGIESGAEVNIIESIATDSEEIKLTGWNPDDVNAEIVIPEIEIEAASATNNRTTTIKLQNTLSKFAAKDAVYTRKEVEDRIKENVTAAYKVRGSVSNEELLGMSINDKDALGRPLYFVGDVYNMNTAGTVPTVKGWGEGSAETSGDDIFPAGTNFVIVEHNGLLAWDALAGNFDTSALEEEIRLANVAIQANKDAIDAEVLRSTNADKTHSDELARIMDEEIGTPLDVITDQKIDEFPDVVSEQTLHQRIDKLYHMVGGLDMGGSSWAEFILNITDAKYVAGGDADEGIGVDAKIPTVQEIFDANGSYANLIDNFTDVASLIRELVDKDNLTVLDLEKEIQDRKDADSLIRLDFASADSGLKVDLEKTIEDTKKAIDNYTVNGLKISTSPTLDGDDILLTGYEAEPITGNEGVEPIAISAEDSVNEAVAKLEKNIKLAVAGQTSGLGAVQDRLDIIEEDLNTDAGIEAKPKKGLIDIVKDLVGDADGSIYDLIRDALNELKDGNTGEGWDDMDLTDDSNGEHENTLTGLKAYVDAQDDAHLEVAKTYTDNEIAKALTWYEAD